MFELPEYLTLARQMNATVAGKIIENGQLGNKPHKFVWYNRRHEEFAALTAGKKWGHAQVKGRWLLIPLEPGFVLVLGECGGKVLFHPAGARLPDTFHMKLIFTDQTAFTVTTQMWGAMELFEQGQERERQYIKNMAPTPIDPEFTLDYFHHLLDSLVAGPKRSVKSLLTQEQTIPGLGNAIAQDIMFRAKLHPRHPLEQISSDQRDELWQAITETVRQIIEAGGRSDETDLFDQPGQYIRRMSKDTAGQACTDCGTIIEKIQYLGGACYFCPQCQK